ncbi:PREDICTED: cinnamate beta-D-glucosyltransferase-like [Populus euphratica]|uniref:Glycosyltransferase n=1 Tax=Populus euphratica TaxID=75702 RepID=A0AAJ6X4D7_POPEU|nr:PREDICTED: cinnamate beta-D-glucosyltransferase-like [Populus euphratica]
MEALTSGMPVVAFPQWGDQVTNAKYLVDILKVGVRMCRGEAENRLITRDEIEKCLLEATVGPKAVEMKQNAMKWKEAAEAAVAEGGSSDWNIRYFTDYIVKANESEIARKCNGSNGFPVSVVVKSTEKVAELIDVQLPCMPLLKHDEVPSFLYPTTRCPLLRRTILGQYKNLDKPFCILMETFEELEPDLIKHMSEIFPIKAVGPLFRNPKAPKTTVHGDLMKADDCIEWLDTKPPSSVVYVSFGSVVQLKQEQWNEIAYGLLNSGISFLLVMKLKPAHKDAGHDLLVLPDGFLEKAGDRTKVVQWSPQEKVLAHPSVACFVTHCGWNSSMEALTSGMPVVAFPQWGDQVTNAKYLVGVFKVGVRMCRGEAENRLITRDEIEKCLLEATVGPKAVEMKQNAMKWKEAAEAAVAEGGSSDWNIRYFTDDIVKANESGIARKCIGSNEFPVSVVVRSTEKVAELTGSSPIGMRRFAIDAVNMERV